MKFNITGVDATTGEHRQVVVEADDQVGALAVAKNQGIFVSRVRAIPDAYLPPTEYVAPPKIIAPPQRFASFEDFPLALILRFVGAINFVAAIFVGVGIGDTNVPAGWIVFASGVLSSLLWLSVAHLLDYLSEAVKQLRKIARSFESEAHLYQDDPAPRSAT
jgi:hypothetical protein